MKSFKSILLYANEASISGTALRQAEALAATNRASLSVVDVLPGSNGLWLTVARQPQLQKAVVAARVRKLGLLVVPAVRRGVRATVQVLMGKPCVEIIREVLRNGHDLVMVNDDADGGDPGRLFGNTALHLLRSCPCPVWVIKRDEHGSRRRILAAVNPGADWWEQDESLRVLALAASVAESDGGELRVVHCLGHWTFGNSARRLKDDSKRSLDELLAKCDLSHVRHDARIERGGVVDVIAAMREEVDVVVLGTVQRGGPAGVLLADTAEKVLARVDCSVLAVKPRGFITPDRFGEGSTRDRAA